jgi:hypothetical protein
MLRNIFVCMALFVGVAAYADTVSYTYDDAGRHELEDKLEAEATEDAGSKIWRKSKRKWRRTSLPRWRRHASRLADRAALKKQRALPRVSDSPTRVRPSRRQPLRSLSCQPPERQPIP